MISVIVVDDDEDSLYVLSEFLELKGINVVGKAKNGKIAVELYRKFMPDVIVTDIQMPKYDSSHFINEIKKINSKAKIIVVTGFQKYQVDQSFVFATLSKPYDVDVLISKIKEASKIQSFSESSPISQALRNVLLRIGKPQFELVESRLRVERNIQFEVCHNFPSNLKTILKDTFGDSYEELLNQLENELGNLKNEQKPKEFLEIMRADYWRNKKNE